MVSVAAVMTAFSDAYAWHVQEEDGLECTLYHGTTWYNLLGILSAGGFIPGQNGHSKCRKHYRGAFGSSCLGEAAMRADITRHAKDAKKAGMNCVGAFAMPVVLEMKACTLVRYHKSRRDVFVLLEVFIP